MSGLLVGVCVVVVESIQHAPHLTGNGEVIHFSALCESHGTKPSSFYKSGEFVDSSLPSDQHFSRQLTTSWAI